MPPSELADLLAGAAKGDVRPLVERHAVAAELETHLPGGSRRWIGAEVPEGLSAVFGPPGEARILGERASSGGSVVRLEVRRPGEPERVERRRHILHVRGGRIRLNIVYPERAPAAVPAPLPTGEGTALEPILAGIVERLVLEPGISGTSVERWRCADGAVRYAKHLRPEDGWIMRATDDRGREAELLGEGVLSRIAAVADHGVIGAVPEPGGWLVVSRDMSAALAAWAGTGEARRRVLAGVGSVHRIFGGERVRAACSLERRLALFSPATARREAGGSDLAPKIVGRGWELFAEVAPAGVGDAARSLAERPGSLARALLDQGTTLLHGDLRPANVGVTPERVALLDWGLATIGPPAFDLAWFAFNAGPSEARVLAGGRSLVEGASGPALDLSLLATLVQVAPYFGFEAVQQPDPAARRLARARLGWWSERARAALSAWSP